MEKILFYLSTISGGGAARVMVNLSNQFYEDGYRVYKHYSAVKSIECECCIIDGQDAEIDVHRVMGLIE